MSKHLRLIAAILMFTSISAFSETVVVPQKGVYREIDTRADIELIRALNSTEQAQSKVALQTVLDSPDSHSPVVLCVAGTVEFLQGANFKGIKLYLVGRLRIIYDVRRCADSTVGDTVQVVDQQFYPTFQDWVTANKSEYLRANLEAISYFANHQENYDQRWINLRGMGAMQEGLGGEPQDSPLSLPESDWPKIKQEIVSKQTDFFQNYEENYFIGRFGRSSSTYFSDRVELRLARAAAKGDKSEILAAITAGADPNFKGKNDVTPLAWAIGSGNAPGVEILLQNGGNPNLTFEKSISGIGLAVFLGKADILELLLNHGGLLDQVEGKSASQLMHDAVMYSTSGELEVIRVLKKHGVSVVGEAGFEGAYLDSSILFGEYEKANLLLELGADKVISQKNKLSIQKQIKNRLGSTKGNAEFDKLLRNLGTLGFDTNP